VTGRRERLSPVVPAVVVGVTVAVIAVFTMAISYEHEYTLARDNGQVAWVAALLPFSVDGMLLVASVAIYWGASHGIRRPLRPMATGAVGIAATIAANMFSDLRFWWLGPAVAASSGLSLVLISDVAYWLLSVQRKLAAGQDPRRRAGCSCPPPATSLAEALPLARQVLKERGELYGEDALADRFGVTRHRLRQALAVTVEPSLNGSALSGASFCDVAAGRGCCPCTWRRTSWPGTRGPRWRRRGSRTW